MGHLDAVHVDRCLGVGPGSPQVQVTSAPCRSRDYGLHSLLELGTISGGITLLVDAATAIAQTALPELVIVADLI